MRIATNSMANSVYKSYSRANAGMASSAEKLSTGLKINRGSDDPAGLGISETLRAAAKGAGAGLDNIANANAFINTADGYLQNVSDILGRMSELSVAYNDGTKSAADQANLSSEYTALAAQITAINAATYNGLTVLGGSKTVSTGDGGSITVNGLTAVAAAAAIGTGPAAAIAAVSTQRAALGASQSQLNYAQIGVENYFENISAAESRVRNVDFAKESATFSKHQILLQSGTAMLAQANAASQNVLQLLR